LTEAGCSALQGVTGVTPFQLDMTDPKSVCRCHSFLQCSTCCDLEQIEDAHHFVSKELKKANGTLWGVVNNAGACVRFSAVLNPTTGTVSAGLIEWEPMPAFQRVLAVNLFGTIAVTKVLLPLIRRSFRGCVALLHVSRSSGRIVNIASITSRLSLPGCAPYRVSKAGVESFSDSLRHEIAIFGGTFVLSARA
jgi:NAD(P)-dependent dehydrogenase (short-subunit alcohol dehydrogenase family)